ncbi:MAG TPA: HAMP domain-containing sensor histidine kinase [Polyangia bacterium]|nr:HAMP domain-containing sensor histidine kinase [Polyangia bacterium]
MPSVLKRAFDRWIEHQDDSLVREVGSTRSWIVSSVAMLCFLVLLRTAPGVRDYFGLRFVPAFLCYVPALLGGLLFERRQIFHGRITRSAYALVLVVTAASQFFLASLMVWSSARGAAAFSSLFIVTAVYHGHVLRATPGEPFPTIGTLVALGAAFALERRPERVALFLFAAAAATIGGLLIGINSRRWSLARRRNEQLRAALTANILDEQAREMNRLSDTLVNVLGHNHDINNTLMALRLNADALAMEAELSRVDGVQQIVSDLRVGFERLEKLARDIKIAGRPLSGAPVAELVDVVKVVEEVVPIIGARFPGVQHSLSADRGGALSSAIPGGVMTMRRITENLLVNACEGNGQRSATRVDIKVARDPSGGRILLVVSDDGPGFAPEQLARNVEIFVTTKPQGTGLGLFTCERLIRACDGRLERANAPAGGAQLTVILPLVRG